MPRSICFYCFAFLLLFSCENEEVVEIDKVTVSQLEATFSFSNRQLKNRLYRDLRDCYELFYQPSKARYGVLLKSVAEIRINLNEFEKLKQNEKSSTKRDGVVYQEQLVGFIKEANQELIKLYTDILNECFEEFGLPEESIVRFQEKLIDEYNRIEKEQLLEKRFEESTLIVLGLEQFFIQSQFFLFEKFMDISGGKSTNIFGAFWPVVASNKACYDLGDSLDLVVGIGNYSTSLDPRTTMIIIGNDTMRVQESGIVRYRQKVDKRGINRIPMTALVLQTLHGKYLEGQSEFVFEVR